MGSILSREGGIGAVEKSYGRGAHRPRYVSRVSPRQVRGRVNGCGRALAGGEEWDWGFPAYRNGVSTRWGGGK